MKAPVQKSNFTPAPQGTHIAICYEFIHIGTIDEEYMGEAKKTDKIRLTFELPNERKVFKEGDEAKPIVISQEYTFSMGLKANLRKLVEGIIGTSLTDGEAEAFDVDSILGVPCLLTIKHKTSRTGKEYAVIATASPLIKGMSAPVQTNQTRKLMYGEWNQALFDSLPGFLKEKIMSSEEWRMKFESSLTPEEKKAMASVSDHMKQRQIDPVDINPEEIPF